MVMMMMMMVNTLHLAKKSRSMVVFFYFKRDMFSRFCHGFCLPFSEFYLYKGDVADFAMDFAGHEAEPEPATPTLPRRCFLLRPKRP
jgi:hypothetical protein